jgi:O-antigen/teichoic acid export membrane protein
MLSRLIINSSFLAVPGFFSILLSIFSIPIHLKIAGPENYGNYIIFHFILFICVNLNLGIGKSTAISINNFPKYKRDISFKSILYTTKLILFFLSLTLILFFFEKIQFVSIFNFYEFFNYLLLGSILTILYATLEGIFQGYNKFKLISFFNLIFYSFSFSLPSLLLFFENEFDLKDLILISILLKSLTVCLMIIYIYAKSLFKYSKNNILYKNLIKNSKWITLNGFLAQFYSLFDKYLIKIYFGPVALTIYSIPQQLTGKLSIISKSLSFFLLPNLSRSRNSKDFNRSLEILMKFFPLIIFILIPFYEFFLKFWLTENFNLTILSLTKIFSLSTIFSCSSHILITEFEASKNLKKNLRIEIYLMPFFLFFLFFLVLNDYSLIEISFLILCKEFILFLLRLNLLKKRVFKVVQYYILTVIYLLMLFSSFYNQSLFNLLVFVFLIYTFVEYYRFKFIR